MMGVEDPSTIVVSHMMFKRNAKPTRDQLLAAIPVKNRLVREAPLAVPPDAPLAASILRLSAPLKPSRLHAVIGKTASNKSFDLDALGAFVWQHADGTRTVEALITHFAAHHQLSLREAEVPVLAFLKTLVERNLVALALPK